MNPLLTFLSLGALALVGHGHDMGLPINPELGVPGFPDCVRAHPELTLTKEAAANDLFCTQRGGDDATIKVGCVGDSITAGVHSTGGNHTYPGQLQIMLDEEQGAGKYSVTNMGACGSMMLKNSSSPFWQRPQFKTLTANKWDVVVIMLGTNDAHNDCHEPGSRAGCSSNWAVDCGGPNNTSLHNCQFNTDFTSMVELIKTLGTTAGVSPKIYVMVPPPLMSTNSGWPEMQTTINTLYPKLIPLMQKANPSVLGTIDIYNGMGGVSDWKTKFPPSCTLNSPWPSCPLWCDKQSCDQCHPDNNGYTELAKLVYAGLGF